MRSRFVAPLVLLAAGGLAACGECEPAPPPPAAPALAAPAKPASAAAPADLPNALVFALSAFETGADGKRRQFDFLDAELATRAFVAGDAFSMADILALTTFDFAAQLNHLHPEPRHANLLRWHAEVSSRPSASA